MGQKRSSYQSKSFNYNFFTDGGAVGFIGMGIALPFKIKLEKIIITPITNLAGLLSTVDIGILFSADLYLKNSQGTTGTFADYNDATFGFYPSNGVFINPDNKTVQNYSFELGLTIGVAPLTAGAFNGTIFYYDYNV